jgi:alkylhydroperoxidase family enzyme
VLRKNLFSAEQVEAIVKDFRNAGLEPSEVAMLAYVEKVVHDAHGITPQDADELRAHGFADAEILDITLAAAARSFFASVLDAVGAEPDEVYLELEEELRDALSVGRPFGERSVS